MSGEDSPIEIMSSDEEAAVMPIRFCAEQKTSIPRIYEQNI